MQFVEPTNPKSILSDEEEPWSELASDDNVVEEYIDYQHCIEKTRN